MIIPDLKGKVIVFLGSCKVSFDWSLMHVTFSNWISSARKVYK